MKKITLLFLFIFASVFNAQAQFPEDFETAVPPSGWLSYAGADGLGTAEVWEASTVFAVSGVQSAFISYENAGGATVEDWLVTPQFTPSAAANILSFQQRQQYTAVYSSVYTVRVSTVSQTAHGDFTIINTQTEADVPLGSWGVKYVDLSAYEGVPIYVAFVMANDDGDNWFLDDVDLITDATAPGCASNPTPVDLATGVAIPLGGLTFSWDVPTTGDAPTAYEFLIGEVSGTLTSLGTTATNSIDITGLGYSTTYYWMVVPSNVGGSATGCEEWSFTTEDAPPPPANDLCSGATALTVGADFTANALGGQTQISATDSGELPVPSCSDYDPAGSALYGGDLWYSVVVPADGNLIIETQGDPAGDGGDTGMSVYSGACGSLMEVDCDDDDSVDGFYSLVTIADPMLANQTLYIRVFEYAGDEQLSFQVSAYSATLSVGEVENAKAFTYFPNPVKNVLTLKGLSNIQNVSIYNMLGQEVLRTAPNALQGDVIMNQLQSGSYFVKVTINDSTETIRVVKQ